MDFTGKRGETGLMKGGVEAEKCSNRVLQGGLGLKVFLSSR